MGDVGGTHLGSHAIMGEDQRSDHAAAGCPDEPGPSTAAALVGGVGDSMDIGAPALGGGVDVFSEEEVSGGIARGWTLFEVAGGPPVLQESVMSGAEDHGVLSEGAASAVNTCLPEGPCESLHPPLTVCLQLQPRVKRVPSVPRGQGMDC